MLEEKNLESLLSKHGFKRLTKISELNNYFDLNDLDEDLTPKIEAVSNTLIVIDNINFNETYLIDLVNKHLDTTKHNNLYLVYIDDFNIKCKLFNVGFGGDVSTDIEFEFEKKHLPPTIITINPGNNEISMIKENKLSIFNQDDIDSIFTNIGRF